MTRAAMYVKANEPLVVADFEPLPPGPLDVVVELTASGVCHSDVSVAQGKYGPIFPSHTILGHEGAGTVLTVGSEVRGLKPGDTVVGSPNPNCGACWFCVRDLTYLCESFGPAIMKQRGESETGEPIMTMAGLGTFAPTMTCSSWSVIKVETSLPPEQIALLGCAVATGVGAATNTAEIRPGDSVAVIGCGGVGQAVVQGARICGASQIIAIDPVEFKRSSAVRSGATDVLDPGAGRAVEQVRELTHGRGVDFAFEVVGMNATIAEACEMIRSGGSAVIVSSTPVGSDLTIPRFFDFRSSGKNLRSSVYGSTRSRRDFQKLIDLAEAGRLDLESMVTRKIALDDINGAFEAMDSGEVIRSVITRF
jgi:S-(hydroxymethyl)glutathione dehydrogenase/alcohol dehydrogenase